MTIRDFFKIIMFPFISIIGVIGSSYIIKYLIFCSNVLVAVGVSGVEVDNGITISGPYAMSIYTVGIIVLSIIGLISGLKTEGIKNIVNGGFKTIFCCWKIIIEAAVSNTAIVVALIFRNASIYDFGELGIILSYFILIPTILRAIYIAFTLENGFVFGFSRSIAIMGVSLIIGIAESIFGEGIAKFIIVIASVVLLIMIIDMIRTSLKKIKIKIEKSKEENLKKKNEKLKSLLG